nr:uncharacterized protein LOC118877912 [Drosophila suzukii]
MDAESKNQQKSHGYQENIRNRFWFLEKGGIFHVSRKCSHTSESGIYRKIAGKSINDAEPKTNEIQSFKTNSSKVQIRIIPQSTTQQQIKSRNIATNNQFFKILPKAPMASSVSLNNNQYFGSWIKVKNPHLPEATAVAKSGKSKLSFLQADSTKKISIKCLQNIIIRN